MLVLRITSRFDRVTSNAAATVAGGGPPPGPPPPTLGPGPGVAQGGPPPQALNFFLAAGLVVPFYFNQTTQLSQEGVPPKDPLLLHWAPGPASHKGVWGGDPLLRQQKAMLNFFIILS